jgi:diacylglycerol kinase (ATP)
MQNDFLPGEIMKNKNFFHSLCHAVQGILYVIRHERNFRIQFCFAVLAILLSPFYQFGKIELFMLYFSIFIVLFMECINTCFERVVDLYTKEFHPLAKTVKDIASGCVLLSSVFSASVGILLFFRIPVLKDIATYLWANPWSIFAFVMLFAFFFIFITIWKE